MRGREGLKSNPAKIMSLKSYKFSDTLSVFLSKRLSRGQIFFHQKAKSESKSSFSPKYLIFCVWKKKNILKFLENKC